MTRTTSSARRARHAPYDLAGTLTALVVGLGALGVAATAAQDPAPAPDGRISLDGPSQPLGGGTMRTYLEMLDGVPVAVGVALSEDALEGLPDEGAHMRHLDLEHAHALAREWVLELPTPNPTPYTHVSFNWNPAGHEPQDVWTHPHFDFHFNIITDAERRTITPDNPHWKEREARAPRAELMPAGYVSAEMAVPLMGVHWIDPTTPELHGETFTQTFIFGAWDGKLIFAEPMITKAFLQSKPDFEAALPLPAEVEKPGYYPTSYAIRWNEEAREYRVSLEGLVEVR
ncbi:MAG TPA: DUF5602 domain-containing protein [Longimicrobiales bacterium]|nr:DUF5602 domain-containing protein [Longimicrobiales bacterium]